MANIHFSYMAIMLLKAISSCIKDSMNTQNSAESTEPWERELAFILFSCISSISKARFNERHHEKNNRLDSQQALQLYPD